VGNVLPFIRSADDNYSYVVSRVASPDDWKIAYIEVTSEGNPTYRATWTYTGNFVTAVSKWVKQ